MQTRLWLSHPLRWVALATGLALVVSLGFVSRAFAQTGASLIAFIRDSDLWVLEPFGSFSKRLTFDGTPLWATWSPDHGKIAYVSVPKKGSTDLWELDLSSDPPTRRPLTSDAGNEMSAEWSPDGSRIVFASLRDGYSQLYTIDPHGPIPAQPLRLTYNPWRHVDPTWSPNGEWIAFGRQAPSGIGGNGYAIWVMRASQDAEERLLWVHSGGLTDLAWSPDGATIAFASGADIWTVDVAFNGSDWVASGEQQLTDTRAGERWPTWFPDGRIAFMTNRDGNNEIYAMNRDGTNPQNLTNSRRTDDAYPACSR